MSTERAGNVVNGQYPQNDNSKQFSTSNYHQNGQVMPNNAHYAMQQARSMNSSTQPSHPQREAYSIMSLASDTRNRQSYPGVPSMVRVQMSPIPMSGQNVVSGQQIMATGQLQMVPVTSQMLPASVVVPPVSFPSLNNLPRLVKSKPSELATQTLVKQMEHQRHTLSHQLPKIERELAENPTINPNATETDSDHDLPDWCRTDPRWIRRKLTKAAEVCCHLAHAQVDIAKVMYTGKGFSRPVPPPPLPPKPTPPAAPPAKKQRQKDKKKTWSLFTISEAEEEEDKIPVNITRVRSKPKPEPAPVIDPEVCCICFIRNNGEDDASWIGCDGCVRWYHQRCVQMDAKLTELSDKWFCPVCSKKPGVAIHVWKYPCANVACPRQWTADVDNNSKYCRPECGLAVAKKQLADLKKEELRVLYKLRLEEWEQHLLHEFENDEEFVKAKKSHITLPHAPMTTYDSQDLTNLITLRLHRDECKPKVKRLLEIRDVLNVFCERVEQFNIERDAKGYAKKCAYSPIVLDIIGGTVSMDQVKQILVRPFEAMQVDESQPLSETDLLNLLPHLPEDHCYFPEDECIYHNRWREIKKKEVLVSIQDALLDLEKTREKIDEILRFAGERNVGLGLDNTLIDWNIILSGIKSDLTDLSEDAYARLPASKARTKPGQPIK